MTQGGGREKRRRRHKLAQISWPEIEKKSEKKTFYKTHSRISRGSEV